MNRRNFITSLLALPVVSLLEKIMPKIRPRISESQRHKYYQTLGEGCLTRADIERELEWMRIKRIRVYRRSQDSNITEQAFRAIDASDKAVQRLTGTSGLSSLGQPTIERFHLDFCEDAFWHDET